SDPGGPPVAFPPSALALRTHPLFLSGRLPALVRLRAAGMLLAGQIAYIQATHDQHHDQGPAGHARIAPHVHRASIRAAGTTPLPGPDVPLLVPTKPLCKGAADVWPQHGHGREGEIAAI